MRKQFQSTLAILVPVVVVPALVRLVLRQLTRIVRAQNPVRFRRCRLPRPVRVLGVVLLVVCENCSVQSLYRRHHFPPEIISHVVWL